MARVAMKGVLGRRSEVFDQGGIKFVSHKHCQAHVINSHSLCCVTA